MSSSPPTNERDATPPSALPEWIKAGAFWSAVLLPFCLLAILVGGLETPLEYLLFVALVIANVVALVVGHGYGR